MGAPFATLRRGLQAALGSCKSVAKINWKLRLQRHGPQQTPRAPAATDGCRARDRAARSPRRALGGEGARLERMPEHAVDRLRASASVGPAATAARAGGNQTFISAGVEHENLSCGFSVEPISLGLFSRPMTRAKPREPPAAMS